MNWAFKFAFDEINELFENRPWLLVDDSVESGQNLRDEQGNSFISKQKQLMLQRGWDWFRRAIRGRFFPNLNITTVTTLDAERHPEMGDPPDVMQQVQAKFPGVTLVSLIGQPHVIEGTGEVDPDVLSRIVSHARKTKWHGAFEKTAMLKIDNKTDFPSNEKFAMDSEDLKKMIMAVWGISAAGIAGGTLAWLLSLGISPQQLESQLQQGASPQDVIRQVSPIPEVPEPIQDALQMPQMQENVEIPAFPPGGLDNMPKSDNIDMRNTEGLDPMFSQKVQRVLQMLAAKGWKPRVAEGLRTIEQQQKKIDTGRSSLKNPQNSKHVQGLAVDVIDSRYGWGGPASDLDFQFWLDLGQAAKEAGCVWGGDWESFKDVAHVESPGQQKGGMVYRHAYRGSEWLQWKQQVIQWAQSGLSETQIGQALAKNGVSNDTIRRLIKEVAMPFLGSAFATSTWQRKYV